MLFYLYLFTFGLFFLFLFLFVKQLQLLIEHVIQSRSTERASMAANNLSVAPVATQFNGGVSNRFLDKLLSFMVNSPLYRNYAAKLSASPAIATLETMLVCLCIWIFERELRLVNFHVAIVDNEWIWLIRHWMWLMAELQSSTESR